MVVVPEVVSMVAAVGLITWNAIITETRRRERRMQRSKRDRERRREGRRIHADSATLSLEGLTLAADEENKEASEMPPPPQWQAVDGDLDPVDGRHVADAYADRDTDSAEVVVTAEDPQPPTPVTPPQSLPPLSLSSSNRVDPSAKTYHPRHEAEAGVSATLTVGDAAHVETVAPATSSANDERAAAAAAVASATEAMLASGDGGVERREQPEEDLSSCGETKKSGTAGMTCEKKGSGRSTYPAMFRELVLIMDAAPLPEPRRKLPGLPEDDDSCMSGLTSVCSTVGPQTPSSPRDSGNNGCGKASDSGTMPWGCDLSHDFYLSRPFSPPRPSYSRFRRGGPGLHRRNGSSGNRPRTFSEYTPGNANMDEDVTGAAAGSVSSTTTIGPGTETEYRRRRGKTMAGLGRAPSSGAISPWGVTRRRRCGSGRARLASGEMDGRSRTSGVNEPSGILDPSFFMEDSGEEDDCGDREFGECGRDRSGGVWSSGDDRLGDGCCIDKRRFDDDGDDEDDVYEGLARSAFEKGEERDGVWMVWPDTGKIELARTYTEDTTTETPSPSPPTADNPLDESDDASGDCAGAAVHKDREKTPSRRVGRSRGCLPSGFVLGGASGEGADRAADARKSIGAGAPRPLYPHAREILPVS